MWGATFFSGFSFEFLVFQSALPVWGATRKWDLLLMGIVVSIRAPRVGSDRIGRAGIGVSGCFNPRSPCGERRGVHVCPSDKEEFQSALPVWGATDNTGARATLYKVSIRAPRVGSDGTDTSNARSNASFQSALPVWGATASQVTAGEVGLFQSALPVWGATCSARTFPKPNRKFQSALPVWGATKWGGTMRLRS